MDDKFLYQLIEEPDPGFKERLRQKLAQNQLDPTPGRAAFPRALIWMRSAAIGLMLVVLLLATIQISPVKAFFGSLLTTIAGQSFEMTSDYPGGDYPADEIIEPRQMSIRDALAAFPYRIKMPGYIPAGYVIKESNVHVYVGENAGPFANTIQLEWWSDSGRALFLRVTDTDYASTGEIVGPNAVEEILLNDVHPAALIRGGWDADRQVWSNGPGVRLRWQMEGLYYELSGMDAGSLIEIAHSTLAAP